MMEMLTKTKRLGTLLKVHGGKAYLAKWIISHFPTNYTELTFVEPYFGGGSVLLQKRRSMVEIANDLDRKLISIWHSVRNRPLYFQHELSLLNYSQETFDAALRGELEPKEVQEFVLRRMSRGGMKTSFAWSERLRRGMPGDVSGWLSAVDAIPAIARRIANVSFYSMDAIKLLLCYLDYQDILVYADPPYLQETRVSKRAYGEFEMTEGDHRQLAEVLNAMQGKVIVSGYHSRLYDELYKGWRIEEKEIVNNASQSKTKRKMTEVLYINWRN